LYSLGTYLFGRCATINEARELGELLWRHDPFRVQHYRKTWGKVDLFPARYHDRFPDYAADLRLQMPKFPYFVLDTEPVYMSIESQREEAANRLMNLGLFDFFLRPSLREGEVGSTVYTVNLASLVQDSATGEVSFPNQAVVA
jgi:hypothetical protein